MHVIPRPKMMHLGDTTTGIRSIKLKIEDELKEKGCQITKWLELVGFKINDDSRHTLQVGGIKLAKSLGLEAVIKDLNNEGYYLRVSIKDDVAKILILSKGLSGVFYALQTLSQVITKNGDLLLLREMLVIDGPTLPLRGIVEGFYYEPWSWRDREEILKFMGKVKMNAYIYAPKDDPYHREKWREKYPPEYIEQFKRLIDVARENCVCFIFSISPGLSIKYSSDEELSILYDKIKEIWELGVKWFAIMLDDIPEKLIHEEDKKMFKSLAEAQAYMLNKLYAKLKELDPEIMLIMCPTKYMGREPNEYLKELGEKLNKEILIGWTGPEVCSYEINAADLKPIYETVGRKLWIWDNYPVNDYCRDWLNLGPIRGRGKGLEEYIYGLFSNPMNEAMLSKIALATIADYAWNPEGYNPDESWDKAVEIAIGLEYKDYIKLIAELQGYSTIWPEESGVLKLFDDFLNNPEQYTEEIIEKLDKFTRLRSIFAKHPERKVYEELLPYLIKLEYYGVAGLNILKAVNTESEYLAWLYRRIAYDYFLAAEKLSKNIGSQPFFDQKIWRMQVKRPVLTEFFIHCFKKVSEKWGWPRLKPIAYTNIRRFLNGHTVINILDSLDETYLETFYRIRKSDKITVELGEEIPIDRIILIQGSTGSSKNYFRQYRLLIEGSNGARDLGVFNSRFLDLFLRNTTAKSITIISEVSQDSRGIIRVFKVLSMPDVNVYTNMKISRGFIENLIDGDLDTFAEFMNIRENDYIHLELNEKKHVKEVVIFQHPTYYIISGVLEYKDRNGKWVEAGYIDGALRKIPVNEKVREVRIRSKSAQNKVIVYEVQIV